MRALKPTVTVFVALFSCLSAQAHWSDPNAIVASLAADSRLREQVGLAAVVRDQRMLIIRVQSDKWHAAPQALRRRLAAEWRESWLHNLPNGIVAVVDAADDTPLVNYDRDGAPRLTPPSTPAPRP